MYTIGRLAKKYHLSRSTLLYYDSIGLLKPRGRGRNNYRRYSHEDDRRLEQICLYRQAGLSLNDIGKILDSRENKLTAVLEGRLEELNEDIHRLRRQQRFIIGLLKNNELFEHYNVMTKETWTSLLAASGFSNEDMSRWHMEFERMAPQKHRRFLEFLGIPQEEIKGIRQMASADDPETT